MGKLDSLFNTTETNQYNDGFNAGINFVKTVIDSQDFNTKLYDALLNKGSVDVKYINQIIINVLKEYNV